MHVDSWGLFGLEGVRHRDVTVVVEQDTMKLNCGVGHRSYNATYNWSIGGIAAHHQAANAHAHDITELHPVSMSWPDRYLTSLVLRCRMAADIDSV